MNRLDYIKNINEKALNWWLSKRPLNFSVEDHLLNPTINTITQEEEELAEAVAFYVKNNINNLG